MVCHRPGARLAGWVFGGEGDREADRAGVAAVAPGTAQAASQARTSSFESTGAGCRGEGDRETDWAGVAAVGEPEGRASRAEAAQAAGEHGECRAHVRPGHQVTEAVVNPAAKTEVRRPVCRGDVEVTAAG